MEIYKDLSSTANQQFEKLLNSQLSKNCKKGMSMSGPQFLLLLDSDGQAVRKTYEI